MMRIAHFAQFGPNACGLYATARDLILAERRLGADAHLVDVTPDGASRPGLRDGPLVTVAPEWAYDADVLIRHTAIPGKLQTAGIPVVMCLHGRPESSYRLESRGDNDVMTAVANKAVDARYRAFVTFWPEYVLPWSILVKNKICYVPAPVDLDFYAGGKDLQLKGNPNILIADMWRDDIVPLTMLYAAAQFIRDHASLGKMHILSLPNQARGLQAILQGLKPYLGTLAGQMKGIRDYYRSCDMTITPHVIATRIVRESLAAGTPVVAAHGCRYTKFTANPHDAKNFAAAMLACWQNREAARKEARLMAEEEFDAVLSAETMLRICEEAIGQKPSTKKLFVDIGAHLGESVLRFYRQRPDAGEFDIYSFEPDPEVYRQLYENVGHIPNVAVVNAALSATGEQMKLYPSGVNTGEGTTSLRGKLTGAVDYHKSFTARSLRLCDWLQRHPADWVVVKMNIEGGEYELLPHLVETGALGLIDELYVQMHSTKFGLQERMGMDRIEAAFRTALPRFKTQVFIRQKGMASFAR